MRTTLTTCFVFTLVLGCGGNKNGNGDDDGTGPDACVGLECQVVDCASMSMPPTTITGTVFAPNGTLPLNGVNVYVPRDPLPPFIEGVSCDRCSSTLPGSPITQTVSGADGTFRLENVPAGDNIPLVVTTGKWRRQVTISNITQCADNSTTQDQTRLPRNKSEGDIPKIALTTGNADSMECLVRKLGIDDSEITNDGGAGRIHFYTGNGVAKFKSGFAGGSGASLSSATPFWASVDSLSQYDIVILSCEGQQNAGTKPQAALDAMKAYADKGGRVFASHWHNIWISGHFQGTGDGQNVPEWAALGTWNNGQNFSQAITDVIDEQLNPKGSLFADWMVNVGGSTTRGEFPVVQARTTNQTLDTTKVERWVHTKGGQENGQNVPADLAQMFQFTTPIEVANDQRCGKVVFTGMHVSGTGGNGDFPDNCVGGATNLDMTPQEKALAFMFFDIASCVGGLF